jgi:hypothetical protein
MMSAFLRRRTSNQPTPTKCCASPWTPIGLLAVTGVDLASAVAACENLAPRNMPSNPDRVVDPPAGNRIRRGTPVAGLRQQVVEVTGIEEPRQLEFLGVAHALGPAGLGIRLGKRGQKHPRQDSNDGDDYKELYQGKPALPAFGNVTSRHGFVISRTYRTRRGCQSCVRHPRYPF